MLKDIKYTNQIIDKALLDAMPSRYLFNPSGTIKTVDIDVSSKKMVISTHLLDRLKERFFYEAEWKEVLNHILRNSKSLKITKLFASESVVEKQFKAELLIGDVASHIFFADIGDKYVFKTIYPIQNNDQFYEAMEQLSTDQKLVNAIRQADVEFMKELNDNFFKTIAEREKFYKAQVVTNVIAKKRKTVKYNGVSLDQVWKDSKREFEEFIQEVELTSSDKPKVYIQKDVIFEAKQNDDEFGDILDSYKDMFE